ncbi:MAG: hypothetical protein ACE5PO_06330 [Candidatus Bathyarchaeia archaeon]
MRSTSIAVSFASGIVSLISAAQILIFTTPMQSMNGMGGMMMQPMAPSAFAYGWITFGVILLATAVFMLAKPMQLMGVRSGTLMLVYGGVMLVLILASGGVVSMMLSSIVGPVMFALAILMLAFGGVMAAGR